MLPENFGKLSSKEQQALGLPPGWDVFTPFPFGSMNQEDSAQGMDEHESQWQENLIRTGKGKLRAVWGESEALYIAPIGNPIVSFFHFNIGNSNYVAIFLNDGTAVQLNTDTGEQKAISSTPGLFYQGTTLPACGQWSSQFLLIVNNNTSNDYWIWDGFVLYSAGTLGPRVTITDSGSGYSSPPIITAYGGSGSGATFTGTINAGSVVAVQVTNPGSGYKPGEVVQLQFRGGGSNRGAILTPVLTPTSIDHISLLSQGSGYSDTTTVSITGGGGTGGAATVGVTDGKITSLTLTNKGSGYTSMPTIAFVDATGTGAQAQIIFVPTTIASVTVTVGGTGFNTVPTVTFVGGGGSGATATASLTADGISSVAVTAPGTGYTSVPALVVQTGVNNSAAATVSLMPFGVSGSSIETFQQRVWIPFPNQTGNQVNGGTFLVSSPGSYTDFATSDGGLVYTSSDSYLRAKYVNIKQSNGYLYPIGDSSVSVISNVQTSGSPTTTTFNYQNTDPQVGTSWRDSCQLFGRTILMANPLGVFGLYGGAVTKISSKMDNLFVNADFTVLTPSSAVANIFNIKTYLLLLNVKDPTVDEFRTVMLAWDEKDWFITSQAVDLVYIGTQEVNSNIRAWGTDGLTLYRLFDSPSVDINKKFVSKLYGEQHVFIQKMAYVYMMQAQDFSGNGMDFDILINNEFGSNALPNPCSLPSTGYPFFSSTAGDIPGVNLGFTINSTSADFSINYAGLAYLKYGAVLGSAGNMET